MPPQTAGRSPSFDAWRERFRTRDSDSSSGETTDLLTSDSDDEQENTVSSAQQKIVPRGDERTLELYESALSNIAGFRKTRFESACRGSKTLKIDLALLQLRLLLLRGQRQGLHPQLLAVSKMLQSQNLVDTLGAGYPILARLIHDAQATDAADYANQLFPLTRLMDIAKVNGFDKATLTLPRDLAGQIVANALELHLLTGAPLRIFLSGLGIRSVPRALQDLRQRLHDYRAGRTSAAEAPLIADLDLSNNNITSLPEWFADAVTGVRHLNLFNNPLQTLPANITRLRDVQVIQHQTRAAPNKDYLLDIARRASPSVKLQQDRLFSLSDAALGAVIEQKLEAPAQPHLRRRYEALRKSYICISCRSRLFADHPQYLPSELRERMYLFTPPLQIIGSRVRRLVEDDSAQDDGTPKAYVVGGLDWRFCASCLKRHVSSEGCGCTLCQEEQRVLEGDGIIRWARSIKLS